MAQPTVHGRLNTLDLIRGVAVLGILLANIPFFSSPDMGAMISSTFEKESFQDKMIDAFRMAFVAGKFRTMLAILFGLGLYLQFEKSKDWPKGYYRRTGLLMLIGFVHLVFIWYGDILFLYSIFAFASAWLVRVNIRKKLIIIGALTAFSALASIGIFLAAFLPIPEQPASPFVQDLLGPQTEIRVFQHGSYLLQVLFRSKIFLIMGLQAIFMIPHLLALFLLGQVLAERRILHKPSEHPRAIKKLLLFGLVVGLPLNLLAFLTPYFGKQHTAATAWEIFIGPSMAPLYLVLLAVAAERNWLGAVGRAFEKVGRMALTCYLLQSVVCTTIFYSWGFGLFGNVSKAQALLFVPLVWAIDIVFAAVWLRYYDIGPVEWLWRSMAEKRRLPLKFPPPELPKFDVQPVTVAAGQ